MNTQQLNDANIENIKEFTPEIYKEELEISHPFFILSSLLFNKGEEILSKDYGINQSELNVLASLYYSHTKDFSLTPTKLKEMLFFTSGGMTKLLKKLERKEYIRRIESHEDKRSKSVQITGKGKDVASKALGDIISFESSYFSKLDNSEAKEFQRLLYKMLD